MEHLDKEEQKIMDLLPKGMDRPRPLKELVKLTGWKGRKIRGIIGRLILVHHEMIGAVYTKPNGYFVITNDDEKAAALAPLTSQIKEMTKRAEIISSSNLGNEE